MFLSLDISSYTPLDDLYDSDGGFSHSGCIMRGSRNFFRGGPTFFTFFGFIS